MRRSRIAAYVGTLLLALGLALTGAGTAQASQLAATGGYVALGDSYSSGVGAGSYISSSGSCDRSTKAYPYLWNAAHSPSSFAFTACSGARTDDVLANQLAPLNSGTSLVSISIGGNDAGFSDVMTTCVLQSDSTCVSRINTAKAYVDSTLPGKLDNLYSVIRSKAPSAHVVVLATRASTCSARPASACPTPSAPPSTARPTTSTPPSRRWPPTTASPSATSAPPSPATRSAPAAPGCTA